MRSNIERDASQAIDGKTHPPSHSHLSRSTRPLRGTALFYIVDPRAAIARLRPCPHHFPTNIIYVSFARLQCRCTIPCASTVPIPLAPPRCC
ncbi:hypothetical protein SESBI_31281 [Sesbania bispinosa]|nr:hypothetical protein SESBI_31281 [Sesbania bispinosa]